MVYTYTFLILVMLALLYMRFEAGFLQVKRVKLSKTGMGLKILQLSDIHMKHLKVPSHRVVSEIKKAKPDIIIITGDYIETCRDIDNFLRFLAEISFLPNIYLCLGNHDYKAFANNMGGLNDFIKAIEALNITVLHNRSVCYEKNLKKYNIIGIEDIKSGSTNIGGAISRKSADAYMNIAFSHNPDVVLQLPRGEVDYLLCGHFHGGQIWMPFNLEFRILRNEKLCRMGIKSGLHKINGINIYINRGLGNVLFPLRFLSRPEITILDLP